METDERLVVASSKLLLLDRLLVRLRSAGRRALIYSQFTSMLDVLADYLAFRGHRFSCAACIRSVHSQP
jgi:SWI/SNF-related matrix-associated actin-dependent regulator of chromatin subfamily A member 5